MNMKILLLILGTCAISTTGNAQGCCSGGGSNPIAGNSSAGVLNKNQFEVQVNYQYSNSNSFKSGNTDTIAFFDDLTTQYLYSKVDYGITDKLTLSAGLGYYFDMRITDFPDASGEQRITSTKGVGDLIVLPRFSIFDRVKNSNRSELTLGLGTKIPLGSNNDSTFTGYAYFINMQSGVPQLDSNEIWSVSPPTIQATTGSLDFIAYAFYFMNFTRSNIRFFSNAMYIRRGWNSLGQKFGDYAGLAVFGETSIINKKMGLMLQLRGEWNGKMQSHENIDMLAEYSIDTASTGSHRLLLVPQIRYSITCDLNVFTSVTVPLYQYMRGTQISTGYQGLFGVSYRFGLNKKAEIAEKTKDDHSPEDYAEARFTVRGKCEMCKDRIEETIAKIQAVGYVTWDQKSQELLVRYDQSEIDVTEMKRLLAKVGHDTDEFKADEEVYEKFDPCCKYRD